MENPFIITGYIKPEYFCDREKEAERIISKITSGENMVVMAASVTIRFPIPQRLIFRWVIFLIRSIHWMRYLPVWSRPIKNVSLPLMSSSR